MKTMGDDEGGKDMYGAISQRSFQRMKTNGANKRGMRRTAENAEGRRKEKRMNVIDSSLRKRLSSPVGKESRRLIFLSLCGLRF
jgi:hypothetical protein